MRRGVSPEATHHEQRGSRPARCGRPVYSERRLARGRLVDCSAEVLNHMHEEHVTRLEAQDTDLTEVSKALEQARRSYCCTLKGTHRQKVSRLMREPALVRAVVLYGKRRQRRAADRARALLAKARA